SGTLIFAPGQTTATFTVAVTNDTHTEPDETVTLQLLSPAGAVLGSPATATLTILDDDPPPTLSFTPAGYDVAEPDGQVTLTVTLSRPADEEVTVAYQTADGTALGGSDYVASAG